MSSTSLSSKVILSLACLLTCSTSLQSTFAQSTKQERKLAEAEKEKIQEKARAIFKAKPLVVDAKEDELQRLLKERFNNATTELETQFLILDNDLTTVDAVGASIHRWTKAGLEVSEEPAAQVKILEMQIVVSRFLELICVTKYANGTDDLAKVLQAKNQRITAELELLRYKKSLQVSK